MAKLEPRDVAAYLLDRADQYVDGSGCWVALADAAHNVMQGEVEAEKRNGSFDAELYRRVDGMAGSPRPVVPESGTLEDDEDDGDDVGGEG